MDATISDFLDFLIAEKGGSENTVAAYRNDLTQFSEFVSHTSETDVAIDWSQLTREQLIDFILFLREREYASSTVARKVAAIKSFFQFLVRVGRIAESPAEDLDSPKVRKQLPQTLTPAEVARLLAQPLESGNSSKALRDTALLEILYATGMRVSEAAGLTLDDLDLQSGSVRCIGKGNKERVIPLYPEALQAVSTYIDAARKSFLGDHRGERTLFLNPRGERLTRQGLWLIVKGYARALGMGDRVTPHTLRHSFATHMLNGGAGLREVQRLLGHANISTTQVYTHLTSEHLKKSYEKAHPRAK